MNWDAIGAIGELVSALVVIISIIYLSRQIKHANRQARLSASQAVDASNNSAFDPIYIPENTEIWTRAHSDPDSLTPSEMQLFDMLMTRLVASFNTTTYHHQQGSYDDELYRACALYFSSFVATPGGSGWYDRTRELWSPAARAHFDLARAKAKGNC
jgi:hypothetical protein